MKPNPLSVLHLDRAMIPGPCVGVVLTVSCLMAAVNSAITSGPRKPPMVHNPLSTSHLDRAHTPGMGVRPAPVSRGC